MKALWKQSTCRNFSEFARKVLTAQPTVMTFRNISLDSLIDLVNNMRADLAKLQENPALSVEEKNRMFELATDIKNSFYQIADLCIPK